ncbi:MAG: YerC/YecD family TrpR-related protein [bacterium]|nr:YerC/YecD family TrpR-related protein [bacterium]
MKDWKTKKLKNLVKIILSSKNEMELLNFFRDLCTLEELEEFSNRWEVVKLLNAGVSYREAAVKTGLSTTTITRIAYWLNNGEGGYREALKRAK